AELVSKWGEGRRMLNSYGPSEATGFTTLSEPLTRIGKPDIGKPMGDIVGYVLDENLQPGPVGVGGELYIGGQRLGRGYRNRAGLTAEKFVPHVFGKIGGERMYRTGDRARWRSDGTLEFIGRLDDQVKVRGYRIELGEIEAALMECAGVEQALVIARGEGAQRQLVAYVARRSAAGEDKGEAEIQASVAELGKQLRGRLPEYMVPSVIVQLEALPLTPNGKVDRKALPEPEYQSEGGGEEKAGALTAEEEILSGIFCEVLNLEQVGTEQSFFELRGHSLLATQVIVRVRSAFNVELPLRVLFEAPTVAELAKRVHGTEGITAPPIVCVSREGDLPLSFAQQRLWFLQQLEPESVNYNIASGVRLRGELNREGLHWAMQEIVRRHEALRTCIAVRDGRSVQMINAEVDFRVEIVDLS